MSLAEAGVRRPRDMELHLKEFIKNDIFPGEEIPEKSNRRFFPKRNDIRAHINRAKIKNRFSKVDQGNVYELIRQWEGHGPNRECFFFRSYEGKIALI